MIEKAPSFNFDTDFVFPDSIGIDFFNLKSFKKIESEYLYWDKVKYLKFEDIEAEAAWGIVQSKRFMTTSLVMC